MVIRFFLLGILTLGTALIANGADNNCSEQIEQRRALQDQIAAAEFNEYLKKSGEDLEKTLREVKESLDAASEDAGKKSEAIDKKKQDAEKLAEQLKTVLEKLKIDAAKLTSFLTEVKAGTDQFKESIDSTSSKIGTSQEILDAALKASNAKRGDEALKALGNYFDLLNKVLGPLAKTIPVIGDFLNLYSGAIKSAPTVASDLQKRNDEQNKLTEEFLDFTLYEGFSRGQKSLDQLRNELSALDNRIAEDGCEEEEEESEAKEQRLPRDAPENVVNACIRGIGWPKDPGLEVVRLSNQKTEQEKKLAELEELLKKLPGRVDTAQEARDRAQQDLATKKSTYRTARQALEASDLQYRAYLSSSRIDATVACKTYGDGQTEMPPYKDLITSFCTSLDKLVKAEESARDAERAYLGAQNNLKQTKTDIEKTAAKIKKTFAEYQSALNYQDLLEDCIERQIALSNLSGIWLQDGEPYKVSHQPPFLLMLKGRNGEGGVYLKAEVTGKRAKDKKLVNATWKYDIGGKCESQWVKYTANTWSDTYIIGTIPNYVVSDDCKLSPTDLVTKTIPLSFKKEVE